ncbi:MAG: hypothetical protein GQ564_00070 [Bacteroidales bacterium]|nr:hypothetical protein [Bacteroidales bacterium]
MINLNIDILICCARSVNKKGSCYKMIIDDYSNEHKVLKEIWTKFSDDVTKKDEIKKDTINEIIKLIR